MLAEVLEEIAGRVREGEGADRKRAFVRGTPNGAIVGTFGNAGDLDQHGRTIFDRLGLDTPRAEIAADPQYRDPASEKVIDNIRGDALSLVNAAEVMGDAVDAVCADFVTIELFTQHRVAFVRQKDELRQRQRDMLGACRDLQRALGLIRDEEQKEG